MVPFRRYLVEIGGHRHHVMDIGEGRPVLCVHGNPSWGFLYRKVALATIGQPVRVIMPDLIGLGFSDKPPAAAHTLDNHIGWFGELIDELELGDGNKILSRYKKSSSGYDLDGLSAALVSIKDKNPQKTDATILLERKIQYDHLVAVMDVVRAMQPDDSGDDEDAKDDDSAAERIILFPDISIGDAP